MLSSRVLDAGHGAVGFSVVRPPVFWPDLPVTIFWNGNVYSVSLYVGSMEISFFLSFFFYVFQRLVVKTLPLILQEALDF